ncbi:MAG: cation-translocating P-type ATPase [Ruminococcus sp.]|jgi:Ca2+-transporting ATPase|nr:cation-translocating P-type ATPase [Ruminococcus sp.]
MAKYYSQEAKDILTELNTSETGLSSAEAAKRLSENGRNELKESPKKPLVKRIWEQISDPMVLILAAAGIISGAFGEIADCVIILAIIVINAILGIVQESKAEQAVEALKKMSAAVSKVKRDGKVISVPSAEIVVGDIVLLDAGDAVPADLRLTETALLKVEEAVLTGESVPIDKTAEALPDKELPLGDRINMAFTGTSVSYGRGVGVAVKTGESTEMGKIADALNSANEEKTPLQKALLKLSKVLSVGVLLICVLVFAISIFRFGMDKVFDSFLIAISLAVAAIPEGLVVVVTVLLSLGVKRMSAKNAIIRKLTAVETLGCTEVICSDKTGTLTQNKMTVVDNTGDTALLQKIMYLCNDSKIKGDAPIGDPTEIALKIFGLKDEIDTAINKDYKKGTTPRVGELPFDSDRKMMSTLNKEGNLTFQCTKGAPDQVLERCTHIIKDGKIVALTEDDKAEILRQNKGYADKALRVIAGAYKETDTIEEKDLIFVGLTGMIDPIRPEVKLAIDECISAGIKPVMITGDHRDTAVAIGKELGLIENANESITGAELDKIPDSEYDVRKYSVYARVSPENKIRIVKAWKAQGEITAMTGDGVNDAPSIKAADIGIGMGITGTDVTKSAADMVLSDDNFATIVTAVGEGRRIYDNIRKAVQFLLGSNLAEVFAILAATLCGFKLFNPIHLLWINLITDTFPAMALGNEPAESDIMKKPPRKSSDSIFSGGLGIDVLWQGFVIAVLVFISFLLGREVSEEVAMTMAFLTLSMCEVFHSFNMRSRDKSIFALKVRNVYIWGATILSAVLTFGVVFVPKVNDVFGLIALDGQSTVIAIGLALTIIPIVEIKKMCTKFKRVNKENLVRT